MQSSRRHSNEAVQTCLHVFPKKTKMTKKGQTRCPTDDGGCGEVVGGAAGAVQAEGAVGPGQKRCPDGGCGAVVGAASQKCKCCDHALTAKGPAKTKRSQPSSLCLGVGCGARVPDKDKASRKRGHPNAAFPSQCKDCGKPCGRRTDCCSICEEACGARLQDAFEDGELPSAPASSVRPRAVATPQPEPMPTGVPEPDEREECDDDASARPKHVVGRPVDCERHCFMAPTAACLRRPRRTPGRFAWTSWTSGQRACTMTAGTR